MSDSIEVTVWNEYRHERKDSNVAKVYPEGMHRHRCILTGAIRFRDIRTATLDEPEHGLAGDILTNTDVLIWWGHMAHGEVRDTVVEKVHQCILDGMGLVVLHSGYFSKIFKKLMGTTCNLKWREAGEKERI